jgi:cell division septation protein DedD
MPITRPSINQLPHMNRQNLERKEIKLGTAQVVGILGITIGSIIAAFCLGFYSGRSLAFERELSNALASMPKLPIGEQEGGSDLGEKIVSEVYAKLNEQNEEKVPGEHQPKDEEENAGPELGSIKESENAKQDSEEASEEIGDVDLAKPSEPKAGESKTGESKTEPKITGIPLLVPTLIKPTVVPTKTVPAIVTKSVPTRASVITVEPTLAEIKEPRPPAVKTTEIITKPKEEVIKSAIEIPAKKPETGWYAQIAAPKAASDASSLASNLKRSGFAAVIETADVRGEKYYRVIVGPEKSKVQADVLLKQLKREPYITGDPFLRMVK